MRCSSSDGANCPFVRQNSLQIQEEILSRADLMALQREKISDYNVRIDFSYYDQITRRNKKFPLDKKIMYKHGVFVVDVQFKGLMLSNDAEYTDTLRRSLFSLTPLETYGYAIGKTFSVKLSLPASLESLSFRPHQYSKEELIADRRQEIFLYRNGELMGKYEVKYYDWQPQQNWHLLTFVEQYQVDEIVFPAGFDFDNIMLSFSSVKILETVKLGYFKQLLNNKREELKDRGDKKELMEETATQLAKEMSQYKITVEDIEEALKDSNDEIIKELLHQITARISVAK
eukprot:TRINITY_DN1070_c0_g2_i7.p1 TRINITY_DN1070_c0_g2~~TRINITY_DN1070_c0_g2_i7.p1  ORF type:complete len:287 (-),score=82.56 TRINITY_DN1070_c0_g2_i7:144-1004(-)